MLLTKYLGVALLLSVPALSLSQDKIKIEPKWDKETKVKLKHTFQIEVDTHKAQIEGKTLWTAVMSDDGYTLTVHHDELAITMDDNDVSPPYNDYKVTVGKKSNLTSVEGGIDGADPARMFVVGNFFVPTKEMTKDEVVKWDLAAEVKSNLGAFKLETTYLGMVEIGKEKGYKFKQVLTEDKSDFSTEGTYTVTASGHLLKADVKFKGMPIPVAGANASGKFTSSVIE